MEYFEKCPMVMIVIGVLGVSVSAILVRFSSAPSAVTAALRLLWTVLLMTPVALGKKTVREEFRSLDRKTVLLCVLSGVFLAIHFTLWFESLNHTSVASSTSIVATEVIWVSLGYCLFMKGRLSIKAIAAIAVAFVGNGLIAWSDSGAGGMHLYGDALSLLAAMAVAVYMLIGRAVRANVSTTVYTYVVYGSCALVLVGLCGVQGHSLFAGGWSTVLIGLGLAVCSTILGHSVFSWCLKFFAPSFVSSSKLCEPVVAAVLAAFLFREVPTGLQVAGGVLIIGSVWYYSTLERKK